LDKGVEIQLDTVSVLDGREWVEVSLLDGTRNFALGSAVRSHTDIPAETRNIRQEVTVQSVSAPRAGAAERSVWPSILGWTLIMFAVLGGLQQWERPGTLFTVLIMVVSGVGLILRSGKFAAIGLASMFVVSVAYAIAVPKMNKQLRLAQEQAAISQIRTLDGAEAQYYSQYGHYACNLAELGPSARGVSGPAAAGIVPKNLAEGKTGGYLFSVGCSPTGYVVNANPEAFGRSGSRGFYSDQTLVIRYSWTTEPASLKSPEVR
jgi:type IV pilus assembly protein PilA